MRVRSTALAMVFVWAAAGPAAASPLGQPQAPAPLQAQQKPQPPPKPQPPARPAARRPRPPMGVRLFVTADRLSMSASGTFDAVLGKSQFTAVGGGVEVTNLVSRVFARVAFSKTSADGERAVIINARPFPLGIPLELKMSPVEVAAGWRQRLDRRGRFVGYVGAGWLGVGYQETSEFGSGDDNTDERFSGYLVFGGVDVDLWKGVFAGVEAQYRTVPNAIGDGGISRQLGETDLGGSVLRVMFGFRR